MYTYSDFESDLNRLKPRTFDVFVLPAFMVWYALKSRSMGVRVRRMLFISGVYMGFRSYAEYKKTAAALKQIAVNALPGGTA